MAERESKSWQGEPIAIEQWMAGALAALASALMLAQCWRISLLLVLAAVTLEVLALASRGMQRYLGMGPARVAVAIAPGCIRFCIISVNLQSQMISKLGVLPLPLVLTGFTAAELSLVVQPLRRRIQLCAAGLALTARCKEAEEWDKAAAAQGAQSAALVQLENLFNAMERRYREQVALTAAAKSDALRSVKQLVDSIINCVEVKAVDFSLKLEATRHTGGLTEGSPEPFMAHIQVGLFHLPAASPETEPQLPCQQVSACKEGEPFCQRVQRDISINGFSLNIKGASGAGLRPEDADDSQPQQNMFDSMPDLCIRLAMPPVVSQLLSGRLRPWRRISADLFGRGTAAGTLNANEALMKVVWALLGRYLAAGAWAFQLQLAELGVVSGAKEAADGAMLHPQPLTDERRQQLLAELRQKPWSKLRGQLQHWAAGCSYYDLLALRLEAAGYTFQEVDGKVLWRMALETMNKYSKDEGLFHELHVSMGLSLDIDLEMGAASIFADQGRLFAKIGPKGTQAGLEVVDGVAVDGHARDWYGGSPNLSQTQSVLVRGGTKLPRASNVRPTMQLSAFLPAEPTGTQVKLILNQARARLLPSPLLGTVLPAALGLLKQDPRPPAPELPVQFVEEHLEAASHQEAPLPDTILGGMALSVEMDVRDSCAVLPLKPQLPSKQDMLLETDLDYDGLVVSAKVIHATLASNTSEESLALSVDAASVVAPGGYEIMEPMSKVELRYHAAWHELAEGPKAPLRSAIVRLPMASLSVSLAVMRTMKHIGTTLAKGFASDEQAVAPPSEAVQEEDQFRRVRRLFLDSDVDNSRELERKEVFKLAERLCVDNYTLTHQELIGAFDEIWTVMDSSNDGTVSFEEFCETLAGGDNRSISNFGSLSVTAAELKSTSFKEGHKQEDDETVQEQLWELLQDDIHEQILGGGTKSSPLTLQWKLLRALRNYSEAQRYWENLVGPKVAPASTWEIEPDRTVLSARELIFAALSDSGQIQQITEDTPAPDPVAIVVAGYGIRTGLKLRLSSEGFRLNLEDPLSQLQGQHRLSVGAVEMDGSGESGKAFEMEVTYWHVKGRKHLVFEDELKARVAVRGFFSTCMNPFRSYDDPQFGTSPVTRWDTPEYIVEPFGFIVLVESGLRAETLTCRFIADTHFVMNVTSSLLLGVKPIVRILMPPEEPDELNDQRTNGLGGTAPLAHLLHGLKQLKQEKLQEFKLLIQDADGAGVGTKVPNEEAIEISTKFLQALDRRGTNKSKWKIPFEVNSPKNLVRIMLPHLWNVTEIHQTSLLSYELCVEAEGSSDAPDPADIRVWSVNAAATGPSLEEMDDERSNNSPSSAAQEDAPKRRSCKSSRKLQVLNRCGVATEVWFEKGPGSKDRLHSKVLDKDPRPTTVEVPMNCTLCVGLEQVNVYKSGKARPDLSSFGRCGAPLYALQGIMSSARADQVQCCLTASLSIGQQGQALLELLPPLELQNATQLPLRLHLYPPYGNESVANQMGILGLTRSSAAWASPNMEPKVALVPPGGTFQVPLHMLHWGNVQHNGGFGKHFWQVMAEAIPPSQNQCSLAFAFPLGGSILRSGLQELELRRSLGLALETTSITGSDPQKTPLQRFTLLLLPGLRIVNSLPVKLRASLRRDQLPDEACDLEPGGIGDFGRSPFECELLLAVDGEEPQSLKEKMPMLSEALGCRSKFKDLNVEQFQLSDNLLCSLQCSWQAGAGPEIVITGKCLVFNKTGLPLQVSDREVQHRGELPTPLEPGHAAVLGSEAEVKIGLGQSKSEVAEQRPKSVLPEKSEDLELRGFADVLDNQRLFCWRTYFVKLQQGRLSLMRKRVSEAEKADLSADPPPIIWHLSRHSRCAAAEPQTTGGVKDCFSVEDPGRGQSLVLHAPDSAAMRHWLSELNRTVQILQKEDKVDEITKGWDPEGGRCSCAKLPELLRGAWCSNGVPIQAIGEGELMAMKENPEEPEKLEVMFLGVQVHTVLSIPRFPGKGVTVTPRFILRNSTASFVQVMPGLLPNKDVGVQEPAVTNRMEEIVKEFSGHRDGSLMDVDAFLQDPQRDEGEAMWIPPGESLAIFHFPLRCKASEAKDGRKAVALRLPGREPLQMILVQKKAPLALQRVGSSGVIPYKKQAFQTGRLPPRMRVLAQEGRLLCFRWKYANKEFLVGDVILTSACEIFIGLPASTAEARWLNEEPWKRCEDVDLRRKGQKEMSMKIFTRQLKAGRCNFDGAGNGCVIFLAQSYDNDYDLHMGKGLPWSGWIGLNNAQEKVEDLPTGSGGVSFMRCSVQVRNSTAFMILSDEPPPYRVENWSDSRTLAVRFAGNDYCEILPPLSWFAFSWPYRSQLDRKGRVLILQDLRTENQEMYQAHKLGPGDDLLLEASEEVSGETAALSEAGFKKVLLKQDPQEMECFARRVAQELSASSTQPLIPPELLQDVGNLSEMRGKLIEKRIVEPAKPILTKRGHEQALLCHHTMIGFVKFLLHCGGFSAKENHIEDFLERHGTLPELLLLLDKLPGEPWVKKEREAHDAFQDLLAVSDVEHTANVMHMLIRRNLEDVAVHPKPSKGSVHALSKSLAETLRNGAWPATVSQWTHFTEEVRLHCLPEERQDEAQLAAEVSDEDAAEEEGGAQPSRIPFTKSDGALDETMKGKTEPITQEGFNVVQSLHSKSAMSIFVKRMLLNDRGEVHDQGAFDAFVESYVEDDDKKLTFSSLRQEIERGPRWAIFMEKPQALHVDRCFDGVSRVFTVRDNKMDEGIRTDKGSLAHFESWDIDVQLAGAQICVVFQAQATSLGCGYTNALDEEVFAVTVDHIQLRKKSKERRVKFTVHHFQIDNLREADRQRPIIICPEDSGYYSDRRESLKHKKNQKETVPFMYFCIENVPSGILHFKELEFILQPVIVRLDLEFWIEIGQQLLAWISTANSNAAAAVQGLSSEDRQILENQIRMLREGGIDVPSGKSTLRPLYLEEFHLGALIAQVEFLMPMKKTAKILKQRQAASGSDSATTLEDAEDQFDSQWIQSMWLSRALARLTHRSHGFMKTILMVAQRVLVFVITSVGSGVLTSLGHVTPRFALPATVIANEFTDLYPFAMGLFQNYCKHGMWESYKVLGSMNILGDPIGWTLSVGGGVKQFFLKTGSDVMTGDFTGEGFKSLAQGVVGGTAAHVGKFFGALGDTVDALTQTGGHNYLPGNVNHVGDGVIVGTQVFGRHVVSGVTGLVQAPIHGFRNKGWRGLGEGFLKGVRGAVAQPVSGLMHGAQHIADGLDATTRLLDHWGQISVRRSARQLKDSQLLPLTGAEFSPRITVWVDSLEFLTFESFVASSFATLGQLRGATYRVLLRAGDWSKACKLGHLAPSGAIQFDQAKWVPIQTLLQSDLEIVVQDCTLQGHLEYDMQIVYKAKLDRNFILKQVARVLQDPEGLAIFKDCTCRWRPSQSCPVRLHPESAQTRHPTAQLHLRFWPAWDPVRVPKTQQWVSKGISANTKRAHPERKEGLLLKKSKGLLHHWSEKWVVLENHEFKYWSDRKDYEQQEPPKVVGEILSPQTWEQDLQRIRDKCRKLDFAQVRDRYGESLPLWVARPTMYSHEHFPLEVLNSKATFKVCYRLADPRCQSRFAAGMDPESYFIQLSQDGEVEAQWQPPDRDQTSVSSWLQAVLRHSILD